MNEVKKEILNINDFIAWKVNLIVNKHLSTYDVKVRSKYEIQLRELIYKYID